MKQILLAMVGGVLGGIIMTMLIDKVGAAKAGIIWVVISVASIACLYA